MRPSPPTHPSSQPSPHSQPPPHSQMMSTQPFMGPRYPAGPRPGVRMPMGSDFNGVRIGFITLFVVQCNILIFECFKPPGPQMMPNNMDPTKQGIYRSESNLIWFVVSLFF